MGTSYGMPHALAMVHAAVESAMGREAATTLRVSSDWNPAATTSRPPDPAAVAYIHGGPNWFAVACDRYRRVEQNVAAVAFLIEAMGTTIRCAPLSVRATMMAA